MSSASEIKTLLAAEVARVKDPELRDALEQLLIEPQLQHRSWDLGAPTARYPTWLVARAPDASIGLAYCAWGYGPERPWGYVSTGYLSLGDSAQWHASLGEAYLASGLRDG